MHLPARNRSPKADRFSSLPAEIRHQIYTYYFADSCIRYHHRIHFSHGKPTKRAYCHGPPEITLLLTNHTIYREALPVLQSSLTLLIDRTEAFTALRNIFWHTHNGPTDTAPTPLITDPFPPLLSELTRSIRHLIVSKIHYTRPHPLLPPPSLSSGTSPYPHLQSTTLYGVYPQLEAFLRFGHSVTLGTRYPHWPPLAPRWCRPLLQIRRTYQRRREVDFDAAATALHAALGRSTAEMRVRLLAWCKAAGTDDRAVWIVVQADLDDAAVWYRWDMLAWGPKKGWRRARWVGAATSWGPAWKGARWRRFERETTVRRRRAVEGVGHGFGVGGWLPRWWPGMEDEAGDEGDDEDLWGLPGDADLGLQGVPQLPTQAELASTDPPLVPPPLPWMAPLDGEGDDAPATTRAKSQRQQPEQPPPPRGRDTPASQAGIEEPATLLDKTVSDWATITDSGDWQSVRSGDVAFKQWDAALEQSWAALVR